MSKTVQIRDLSDEVYAAIARRAAAAELSVPEYLRKGIERMAARPSVEEWLERTRRPSVEGPVTDTLAALDELRGPWPT